MTERDVATEHPNLNERCEPTQGGTPRTPPARRREIGVPDNRMLWKGTALMRFAPIPTINSVLSNVAELTQQSRHVFGFPMENRTPMTTHDGESELP
jgi:hypothetical protein